LRFHQKRKHKIATYQLDYVKYQYFVRHDIAKILLTCVLDINQSIDQPIFR
jgi:hypothetical protein